MNNLKKITYAALISVLTIGAFDSGVTLIPTAEARPMRPAYDEQRVMTRAETQEIQERLDRLARARPDLNSRINRTRARLDRLRFVHIGSREMASLNRDLMNLSILAMDRIPSQEAVAELRADNNNLQAENNKLREGAGFLKVRNERLREDRAELRKDNDILVSKTAAMRENIARLSTALASARTQVRDMKERFAAVIGLRTENAELKETILTLRKHAAATNAQVDRLRDEIRNLRARIAATHRHRPRRAS
jgi:chromosome segregation ATPase